MLDYVFFMFCFLSILNLKIKGLDNFFNDYIEINTSNSIKGVFVWLIIFHHKSDYGIRKNYLFKKITTNLGQKIVSMFLFYSGFGICESIKKKGIYYTKTLPIKALIIFLKSQIILLLFLFANIFIFKYKISWKQYFLSIIFKSSLGNSNWFAFTIIILYLYSYLSFRFMKNHILIGIIIISFISFFHIILVYKYYYPLKIYSVDTIFCFVCGYYYSYLKIYIDLMMMKNDINYFLIISIVVFIFYKVLSINNLFTISITNTLFAILIVFISMKVKLCNEFLESLNSHSYSIYLLQRLILWLVHKENLFKDSEFIQIIFEFTSIIFLSLLFDKYTAFIDKFFKGYIYKIGANQYSPIDNINHNDIINLNLISLSIQK